MKATETETVPDIQAAPDELAAMRPAWDRDVLTARQAGRTRDRTLAETVRLMRSPDGSPWDLKRAAASPVRREYTPGAYERGAATARELLEGGGAA